MPERRHPLDRIDGQAHGLINVAESYSGEQGAARLAADGYQPEMIEPTFSAGTRTMKFRGGMGLLDTIGKYGMYRLNNTMALLDTHVRGVGPDEALAGRNWSNYTWHGDQAPGHPFVHGLQTSEPDFNDLSYSRLTIQVGKNLVENKMPESHFFSNVEGQGGLRAITRDDIGRRMVDRGFRPKLDYRDTIRLVDG